MHVLETAKPENKPDTKPESEKNCKTPNRYTEMPRNFRNRKIGNGEERDSPLTHDDERKIVELRTHNLPPREIGRSIGRPEQVVRKYLQKLKNEYRRDVMREYAELMHRQLSKYHEIEAANWEKMKKGDPAAGRLYMDAIAKENELFGLTREHFDRIKREKEEI